MLVLGRVMCLQLWVVPFFFSHFPGLVFNQLVAFGWVLNLRPKDVRIKQPPPKTNMAGCKITRFSNIVHRRIEEMHFPRWLVFQPVILVFLGGNLLKLGDDGVSWCLAA